MNINRVKVYARRFELVCMALLAGPLYAMLVIVTNWLGWCSTGHFLNFSFLHRILITAAVVVGAALGAYVLSLCIRIARLFQKDSVFSGTSVQFFSHLGKMLLLGSLYEIALSMGCYKILMSYVPLLFDKEQVLVLTLSFGSTALIYITSFGFLLLLAHLAKKASSLQNDQDLTI